MHGCGPAHVSGCAHLFLREHPHRMTHASRVCTLIFGRAFQQSDIHAFMEAFMLSCFHGSTVATFMESFMLSWKHSGNFHGIFHAFMEAQRQLSWKLSAFMEAQWQPPTCGSPVCACAAARIFGCVHSCECIGFVGVHCIACAVQCIAFLGVCILFVSATHRP